MLLLNQKRFHTKAIKVLPVQKENKYTIFLIVHKYPNNIFMNYLPQNSI